MIVCITSSLKWRAHRRIYNYLVYNSRMYIPQGFNHMYGIPLIMEVGSLNTKIGFAGK